MTDDFSLQCVMGMMNVISLLLIFLRWPKPLKKPNTFIVHPIHLLACCSHQIYQEKFQSDKEKRRNLRAEKMFVEVC
jgi:hypothetical protein